MLLVVCLSIAVHAAYLGSKVAVSLYALHMGASQITIGVLAAMYAAVPLVLGIYSGRLVDTKGTRAPLMAGAAVMCAGLLITYFGKNLAALFATAVLAGAGFIFFNVSIQTLTGSLNSKELRPRNFSILSIGYSISTLIGPVSVGLAIDHFGYPQAFVMLAIFTLAPIAVLPFFQGYNHIGAAKGDEAKRSALDLLKLPPVRSVVIISGLVVAAWDLFAFYLPVYGHQLNFSATVIGVILGVYAFAAFITRFAMPALLRRWRGERVMFACLLFAAAAFAAFPLSLNLYYILAVAFCLGLGLGCGQPLSMMIAFNRSPAGREGEVTGLRLTANNVARVGIPVMCGALGAAFGAAPVFWINAVNLSAVSILVWRQ